MSCPAALAKNHAEAVAFFSGNCPRDCKVRAVALNYTPDLKGKWNWSVNYDCKKPMISDLVAFKASLMREFSRTARVREVALRIIWAPKPITIWAAIVEPDDDSSNDLDSETADLLCSLGV